MNQIRKLFGVLAGAILMFDAPSCAYGLTDKHCPCPAYNGTKQAWPIRYVLFVDNAESIRRRIPAAHQENVDRELGKRKSLYLFYEELFEVTTTIKVSGREPVGLVLLTFDNAGQVITPYRHSVRLSGKLDEIGSLVLLANVWGDQLNRPFYFADWRYVPGADYISPAVCAGHDDARYRPQWQAVVNYMGNFGCREWTAQLYDKERPYIDVTSYEGRDMYIAPHVGWSRFEDPPKPVIGRHGRVWLCLHECPAGEQPGIIPDIKKWAAKHGFPLPKRPARQPEFPNSNWPDAIDE